MYALRTYLFLSFFFISIFYNSYSQLTKKKNGMVVSDSKIASEVGVKILKLGGNAVDASIASAFALAVTYPAAGNIGGGGFVVYFNAERESVTTIDFREKAPLKSYEKMYLDENGQFQTKKSSYGIRSIGVPGTVDGLYHFHKKYGKLPWKVLIQPSIDLSKNGFKMTNGLFNSIKNQNFHQSKKYLKTYFNNKNGNLVKPGELWIQESLSKTLAAIRDN
ncbi:MAG: gamma-glutamyltransferase, partial [Bacteroidota bacterium]|nr:gamma-glutamyltransferase [Bacteroidota bacterium]